MTREDFEEYVWENFGAAYDYRGHEANSEWHMMVAAMGLAGETGEVMEHIKKYFRDGKPVDYDFLLEAGDVLHYLTYLLNYHGYSLENAMDANIAKLNKRYGR